MNSSITKQTDTEVSLNIKLDQAALAPIVKSTFNGLRSQVKAAGFRPGKAPDGVVEKELGSQRVQAEVLEAATIAAFGKAVKEQQITTIAAPQIDLAKFVPYTELEFNATVEVMPKVKLADYRGLRVPKPEAKVEASEVEQTLRDLQQRLAERTEVERAAAEGDALTMDFEGTRGGEPVEGATAKSYELVLGSKTFIPGFEEELVGLKPGDSKTFDIVFPKDYQQQSLAGQKVTFKVDVVKVKSVTLPELDDSFATHVGPFKTLDDLKADIRQRLMEEKQAKLKREYEQQVIEKLIAGSKLSLPSRLVDEQIHQLEHDLENNLRYSGLDMTKYLEMQNQTHDQLHEELKPRAEQRVAAGIILQQIAQAEQVRVEDAEVEAQLESLKVAHPDSQAELAKPEVRQDIVNHLLLSKTLEIVLGFASQT